MKNSAAFKKPADLHEARLIQENVALHVSRHGKPLRETFLLLGTDLSFDRSLNTNFACAVLMRYPELSIVDTAFEKEINPFPYIPGYLAFRELPSLHSAILKLQYAPDVIMVDGHGISHPRRAGIASHLGVLLEIPTIGVAKSKLCGEHADLSGNKGSHARLVHEGDVVGFALRTRSNVKPIFVSVGHALCIEICMDLVLSTCKGYRLPEPQRIAHRLAGELRKASQK